MVETPVSLSIADLCFRIRSSHKLDMNELRPISQRAKIDRLSILIAKQSM